MSRHVWVLLHLLPYFHQDAGSPSQSPHDCLFLFRRCPALFTTWTAICRWQEGVAFTILSELDPQCCAIWKTRLPPEDAHIAGDILVSGRCHWNTWRSGLHPYRMFQFTDAGIHYTVIRNVLFCRVQVASDESGPWLSIVLSHVYLRNLPLQF